MYANKTGSGNTAVGFDALQTNVGGTNNTAIGANALRKMRGGQNIALGANAGSLTTSGGANIYIGHPGVKADTMIIRFVASALHVDSIESTRAREAVLGAAQLLDVQARDLDHAIWRHQSGRPVRP